MCCINLYKRQGPLLSLVSNADSPQVTFKPGSRLPLLFTKPTVTLPVLQHHCPWPVPIYITLWIDLCVNDA